MCYVKGWGFICMNLLDFFKNLFRVVVGFGDEFFVENDVDDIGFGIGFMFLNMCKCGFMDVYFEIIEIEKWVGQYVKEVNVKMNGQIMWFVQERLVFEVQQFFVFYLV